MPLSKNFTLTLQTSFFPPPSFGVAEDNLQVTNTHTAWNEIPVRLRGVDQALDSGGEP